MNDDELRALIRAAIQRHMGDVRLRSRAEGRVSASSRRFRRSEVVSISFGQYRLERAAGDTSCLIEPAVQCNHCGFCKCHGH